MSDVIDRDQETNVWFRRARLRAQLSRFGNKLIGAPDGTSRRFPASIRAEAAIR